MRLTSDEIAKIFSDIELELIASLKRNLEAHRSWEQDLEFDWTAWQSLKIKALERFRKENKEIFKKQKTLISKETRVLLEEQFREGEKRTAEEIGEFGEAETTNENFFDLWDEKQESLIEEIQGKETTVEKAALRMMDDVYRSTIYKAELTLSTGSGNLQKAIENAVADFAKKGINCIEYRDGRRVNIADYVQMALRTANTRAALLGGGKQRMALGIDTVRVSTYNACSDTCMPWQGGIYIDDVFAEFDGEIVGDRGKSRSGKWYMLLSVAVAEGLFHPNCRHTLTSYKEGARPSPTVDEEKVKENYRLEQQQRALERKIRYWKRRAAAEYDPSAKKAYEKQVKTAEQNLRIFIAEHKDTLRRDPWREKIYEQKVASPKKSSIIRGAGNKNTTSAPGETVTKEYGYIPKEQQEQFIDDFVKKYAKSDVEHMLIIDKDDFAYYVTSNLPDEIKGDEFADKMAGSFNIHTHPPDETQFSFSTDIDIPAFFADGSAVMEAVDYKYRYRFERPNVTFEEWEQVRAETQENLDLYYDEYGVTFENYEEMRVHMIIDITCKKLGLKVYKRWKI